MDETSEMKRKNILRLSNEESNRMTKECLQIALLRLMTIKNIENISISELVEKAGVSRSAFYRNYKSKEDILVEISLSLQSNLASSLSNPTYKSNDYLWFKDCFARLKEYEGMLDVIVRSNLTNKFFGGVVNILLKIYPTKDPEKLYKLVALEGAFTCIVFKWIDNGCKESSEEMAKICVEALDGLLLLKKN